MDAVLLQTTVWKYLSQTSKSGGSAFESRQGRLSILDTLKYPGYLIVYPLVPTLPLVPHAGTWARENPSKRDMAQ
jgi:hypothetical protein